MLHRDNLDGIAEVIALAESLDADRLELANTQYLGWALVNRQALLPTREQLERARDVARAARRRLTGRHGGPVRHARLLRRVSQGVHGRLGPALHRDLARWPGPALPRGAHAARPDVRQRQERSLGEIWRSSAGFTAFRGESWMAEPCRSCERRGLDFGGCRCQAYHLTG